MSSIDYSRFYLCGSNLIGYQLCCLDCDEDDGVPWLTDDPTLDLGEMVRMADEHIAARHPDGQPDPGPEAEQVDAVEWATTPFPVSLSPGFTLTRAPEFTGVLSYLEGQR